MSEGRYPLQPLLDAVGIATLRLWFDHREIARARREGLTERRADRWAMAVGEHPFSLWPEMVDAAIERELAVCARPGCEARFVPVESRHRFCSRPCSWSKPSKVDETAEMLLVLSEALAR